VIAAAAGAILGDNVGFWVGREGGYRLLRRYGRYVRIDERMMTRAQYVFCTHGGTVVFFGRFVAVLRALAAFLVGTNRMAWPRFLVFNAAGVVVWATIDGRGGYLRGNNVHRVEGPVGIVLTVLAVIVIIACVILIRRNDTRLEDEAERAMPGPFDRYHQRAR